MWSSEVAETALRLKNFIYVISISKIKQEKATVSIKHE